MNIEDLIVIKKINSGLLRKKTGGRSCSSLLVGHRDLWTNLHKCQHDTAHDGTCLASF